MTPTAQPHAGSSLDDQLTRFLEMSHDLLSLVQHENAIMLKDGMLSFEAYIARKMDLMKGFEKEAQNLLNTISAEKDSSSTQAVLAGEVKRIRDALQINSIYQIQTLRKKNLQDMSVFNNETKTESACH